MKQPLTHKPKYSLTYNFCYASNILYGVNWVQLNKWYKFPTTKSGNQDN